MYLILYVMIVVINKYINWIADQKNDYSSVTVASVLFIIPGRL